MKYKYMTEGQVKAIDKFAAEGNGETLMAFALECKDVWETGFIKGFRKGLIYNCAKRAVGVTAGVAGVVVGLGIVGFIADAVEKNKNTNVEENKDTTEVIDG